MRDRRVDQIAAGGVQHALRLAGRARGVKDEQRILGAHLGARAFARHHRGGFVVPDVPHRIHVDFGAGTPDHDHVVDRKSSTCDLGNGRVGVGLERHFASAAQAFVGGDDDLGLTVLDPSGERFGREAAEHDGMNGPDARAGEHRVSRFRDHRHVDGDAVALLDVAVAQDVGHPAHLVVQFLVGDVLGVLGVVALPDDRSLVGALRQVPVDAVVGGVERAVLEPLDRDVVRIEGGILDPHRRPVPMDALGMLGPEAIRIGDRARVHFVVLGVIDEGALAPLRRNVVDFLGHFLPPTRRARRAILLVSLCPPLCDAAPTSDKSGNVQLWSPDARRGGGTGAGAWPWRG